MNGNGNGNKHLAAFDKYRRTRVKEEANAAASVIAAALNRGNRNSARAAFNKALTSLKNAANVASRPRNRTWRR